MKSWLPAVTLVPPTPPPLRHIVPSEVGHFNPLESTSQTSQSTRLHTPSNHIQNAKTTYPPKIVYPEDSLRAEFYKSHPYEVIRPRCLVETEATLKNSSLDDGSEDLYKRDAKKPVDQLDPKETHITGEE
jgi:small subunit ribosomal protein S23